MKKVLKTLWIAILSTLAKLIAQNLTKDGFKNLPTLGQVPVEYFLINFVIFAGLAILFIYIVDLIPAYKLLKGLVFSLLVSIVWIALAFQPELFENFKNYLVGILVFLFPMLIYGMFLGYLSTEKKVEYGGFKKPFKYYIISLGWLSFHLIFMFFFPPSKGYVVTYLLWLLFASIIIGLIFGFFYDISLKSSHNSLLVISVIVATIFLGFYLDRYSSDKSFEWVFFIRVLLDVVSVILFIQVLELPQTKKIINKDKKTL